MKDFSGNKDIFKASFFDRYLYWNYRTFFTVKAVLKNNINRAGALVMAGIIATGTTGIDTNRAIAYQAFSFLVCLALIAFVMRRFSRRPFSARRSLPKFGTAGVPLEYKVFLSGRSRRTETGLSILEQFSDPRPTLKEFVLMKEPGEEQRNRFDRRYRFYRWLWLCRKNEIAEAKKINCPFLTSDEETEISVNIVPRRRGILRFDTLAMVCPDPVGLFNSLVKIPLRDSIIVLPKRYPIPDVALPGTMKYQQGGVALASAVGESEEFVALRDYRPGDSLRRLHWKSWAKTGAPVVKDYEEEFFVRHALILDTFGSGIGEDIFEEAVSVAASFACTAPTQESLLDLLFVGPEAYCFTAGRSLGQSEQMQEVLASVKNCMDQPFESLNSLVLGHVRDVSGCICIFLAWDSARADLVQLLEALGLPMKVFVICQSGEAEKILGNNDSIPPCVRFLEADKVEEQLASV